MAIRMVAQIGGKNFQLTLSRDDAGNYVAEGALLEGGPSGTAELPRVRVIDAVKERALHSLYESLHRLVEEHSSPDAPAAA